MAALNFLPRRADEIGMNDKWRQELRVEIEKLGPLRELRDKLILVKVGSDDEPATEADLSDIGNLMSSLLRGTDLNVMVTHHAVKVDIVPLNNDPEMRTLATVGTPDRPSTQEDRENMVGMLRQAGVTDPNLTARQHPDVPGDDLF
jgi:hypothetical protein